MADERNYDSYTSNLRKASNVAEQRRRKLTADCLKTYNYIQSALDYMDDINSDESILDEYEIYNPESYDWFDEISDEEANYAYDEYEKVFNDSEDVEEIKDIIKDVRRILKRLSQSLEWTRGE